MSTPQFTRTAPVFPGRRIQIYIDQDNPLDAQLQMITGDGWNAIDWTDTLATGEITHKASGLRVFVGPANLTPAIEAEPNAKPPRQIDDSDTANETRAARAKPMKTRQPAQSGSLHSVCSDFVALCHEWIGLAPQKWREERQRIGHWVGLEAGFMSAEDMRRRAKTSRAVQAWTVQWFAERGWRVKIELHPDGEQFRPLPLHGPNEQIQTTKPAPDGSK